MGEKRQSVTSTGVVIPEKLYFRIGEVARLAQLPTYVLRFWETEFPQLKPTKGSTGQRMYRRRDVELVLRIKGLVHEQGFTLAGAREQLKAETKAEKAEAAPTAQATPSGDGLARVREGLREILAILERPIEPRRNGTDPE
jgi:DNA-binding transcriptional MerR regulator